VALAFVPSSLLLAVTTYVSTDIAAVPLLWVVPLGLYLLTFVAAFSARAEGLRRPARVAFPLVLVPLALLMCTGSKLPQALMLVPHVLAFVTAAFICHAELADERPSPAHLTAFYLWISLGGMLGGLFNALVAPFLFKSVAEYPIVLILACFMLPARARRAQSPGDRLFDIGVPLAVGACAVGAAWLLPNSSGSPLLLAAFCVPAFIAFSQRRRPMRFALSMGALLLAGIMTVHAGQTLYAERTFFGVYRVQRDGSGKYVALAHGTTLHGMQAVDGKDRMEPLTYYHRLGPFGQAFDALSRVSRVERAAVIGLGVGTLAAYADPAQRWTFYEIDPAVERIARDTRYFTFLQHCGGSCRVVIGDARLSLAHSPNEEYDLLTLDAFSSDAIPVHLLTSEALSLYLARLSPHGEMLFHISNAHLALAPVVARLAEEHGLVAMAQVDTRQPGWPESRAPSSWVAMARHKEDLGTLMGDARWTPLHSSTGTPLWTDDFSNILSVVQLR
jgi:spermidine synthase